MIPNPPPGIVNIETPTPYSARIKVKNKTVIFFKIKENISRLYQINIHWQILNKGNKY